MKSIVTLTLLGIAIAIRLNSIQEPEAPADPPVDPPAPEGIALTKSVNAVVRFTGIVSTTLVIKLSDSLYNISIDITLNSTQYVTKNKTHLLFLNKNENKNALSFSK